MTDRQEAVTMTAPKEVVGLETDRSFLQFAQSAARRRRFLSNQPQASRCTASTALEKFEETDRAEALAEVAVAECAASSNSNSKRAFKGSF